MARKDGLIDQMADQIKPPETGKSGTGSRGATLDAQISDCLLHGVDTCKAACKGGCHDYASCLPDECGGAVSGCGIGAWAWKMLPLRVQIYEEVQAILDLLKGKVTTPQSGSCETSGGTCVTNKESCPSGYSESSQYACKETDKKCCISTTPTPSGSSDQQVRDELATAGIGVNKTCQNSSSCSISRLNLS